MMENLEITSDSSSDLPIDYGLNGDNLDWQRKPSIYSSHMGTESIYWFNVPCYKNRVSCWDLDDSKPIRPVLDLTNSSFLPHLRNIQIYVQTTLFWCCVFWLNTATTLNSFQDLFQVISLTNSARI